MTTARLILLVILITAALLFALVLVSLFDVLLTGTISSIPGLGWVENLPLWLLLFWAAFMLPARFKVLKRPLTLRGTALIDAPVSAVWNTVAPRAGAAHYSRAVVAVQGVEGDPRQLDFQFDPKMADDLPPLRARIEEVQTHRYMRLSRLNADAFPLWAQDLTRTEYFLEPEQGMTRLTIAETLDKIRVSTFLSMLFLNSSKDAVSRVAALCEGREDTSWLARMTDAITAEGDPNKGLEATARRVGFGVCGLLAAITAIGAWSIVYVLGAG